MLIADHIIADGFTYLQRILIQGQQHTAFEGNMSRKSRRKIIMWIGFDVPQYAI
jgi:hypothetical protein